MAKTTAPLLSFGASGQIGQTLVASKWKGRPYMRRYATPTNPNTTDQQEVRGAFQFLNNVYKVAPTDVVDAWAAYAQGQVMTDRNAWIKKNLPILRPAGQPAETDLDGMIFSPGARGGLQLATFTVTPGNDQLTLAATVQSTLPSGWSVVSVCFGVLRDQDPASPSDYVIHASVDASSAYSVVIASLASAVTYQCFAFAKYLRPDGLYAYSVDSRDQGLTT